MTGKLNKKGFAVAGVSNPEKCVACRICEVNCPDLAIFIEKDAGLNKEANQ
jgi:NAD-dependent dihydropyrimidine dehydrogenase PreA subunit